MGDRSIAVVLEEGDYDRLMRLCGAGLGPEAFVALGLRVLLRLTDAQRNALIAIDAFGNKVDNAFMARNAARRLHPIKRRKAKRTARKPVLPMPPSPPEDTSTHDAVMRMLADLDRHPIRHSAQEIEGRLAEVASACSFIDSLCPEPQGESPMASKPHPEDIVVWPDGTHADYAAVMRGEYLWMSDDYEIVPADNVARLRELGVPTE